MEDAYTKSVEEVTLKFKTDDSTGLTDDQVKQNQAKYGPNGMYDVCALGLLIRALAVEFCFCYEGCHPQNGF